MKVYVVFISGYASGNVNVGVFSSYELADRFVIDQQYDNPANEYDIEEWLVDEMVKS